MLEHSNDFDPNSPAAQIICFIASLFGMDDFEAPRGSAAIDLRSGLIVRAHEVYPEGEMLKLEFGRGPNDWAEVHAYKFVDSLLVRHAEALAITNPEGGSARDHYVHIAEHFQRKTGVLIE